MRFVTKHKGWQLCHGSCRAAGRGRWYVRVRGCSVHPSGAPHAGGAGRVVSAVMGNPAFPCESILTALGERAGAALIDLPQVGMWEGISFPRNRWFFYQLTAISVGKFQPADAGAGPRAGCTVLHTRPVQGDRGMLQTVFSASGAWEQVVLCTCVNPCQGRVLPAASLPEAAACLPHGSAWCWTQNIG